MPGRWLIFDGRGRFGPPRYACAAHRGDLAAYLREHCGAVGLQVGRRPPYRSSLAHSDVDRAWRAATTRQRPRRAVACRGETVGEIRS